METRVKILTKSHSDRVRGKRIKIGIIGRAQKKRLLWNSSPRSLVLYETKNI